MALQTRIQSKTDTAANWEQSLLVAKKGELIIYAATPTTAAKLKIGDGIHIVRDLPFVELGGSDEIIATRLAHPLIFRAHRDYIYDGSKEIILPIVKERKIIDISRWQGDIDFGRVKQQVEFIIARAASGANIDPKFDEYAQAMIAHDIPFGVYCYSYATNITEAENEAENFVLYANKYNPLFYVIDAERDTLNTSIILGFLNKLRQLTDKRDGCYVAHNRYNAYNYSSIQSQFDFTWIPRYGRNDGTIEGSTKPAYFCDLWQYTSTGQIDGIEGNVDMSVITGDGKSLNWFLYNT
jgi:GH25 family lysozyme M1 (1,4-beta-N-acetylmuramidase)